MMREKGFSLLELLAALLMVSLMGVGVQMQVWRHWRWVSEQEAQAIAVLQMRNWIQQQRVTPLSWQDELFMHWQTQHAQALPGSLSHRQMHPEGWRLVLGWPVAGEQQEFSPQCQQAGVSMPRCLIF